jgi:hypothetical protein
VQTQAPKTKVTPWLKAMVGLISGEIPYLARQLSVF